MSDRIRKWFCDSAELIKAMCSMEDAVYEAAGLLIDAIRQGGKILVCGNGGSEAEAQHFAAELAGRFRFERRPFPAFALSDPSVLTAISNDYGYEQVFARQVQALGRAGDVLVAITTSGRSPNILRALDVARQIGIKSIVMSGHMTGEPPPGEALLIVPDKQTARVQEVHLVLIHALCELIETALTGEESPVSEGGFL